MNEQAIIDWLKAGGGWAIFAALAYALKISEPFIQEAPKYIHSKRIANRVRLIDKYATNAITTVSSFANLSNSERKAKAVSIVADNLAKHSINVSADELSSFVENAYNVAKNQKGLKDVPSKQTSTTDQTANNQAQQVNQQLNPQPVQGQQQNGSGQSNDDDDKAKQLAQQVQNNPKAQSLIKEMNKNGNQGN